MVSSELPVRTRALPATGRYVIDPAASTVTFRTRHLFGMAGVVGTIDVASGEIVVREPESASTANVALATATFASGNPRRDADVTGPKFLDAENRPEITFEGRELRRSDDGWVLAGTLTACGTTQPCDLDVTALEGEGTGLTATATTTVDRYAFGITAAKGMAGKRLGVELAVTARRA